MPTLDPANPYTLSHEEAACLERMRTSFLASQKLADQVRWMTARGRMHLVREGHLIFHGCVPVDEQGNYLSMAVAGRLYCGKALFDAIEREVYRLVERPPSTAEELDLFWYLWSGPQSPLFGKDRITTFERDLIADPRTHHESKNPYFQLIHEAWFCDKILAEFGVDPSQGNPFTRKIRRRAMHCLENSGVHADVIRRGDPQSPHQAGHFIRQNIAEKVKPN